MRVSKTKKIKKSIVLPNSLYYGGINLFGTTGSYYSDFLSDYVVDRVYFEFNVILNPDTVSNIFVGTVLNSYKDITYAIQQS